MHRVALIIVVVLGFLIAYQSLTLIAHRFVIFGKTGIFVAGCCVARGASKLYALYPCLLSD